MEDTQLGLHDRNRNQLEATQEGAMDNKTGSRKDRIGFDMID